MFKTIAKSVSPARLENVEVQSKRQPCRPEATRSAKPVQSLQIRAARKNAKAMSMRRQSSLSVSCSATSDAGIEKQNYETREEVENAISAAVGKCLVKTNLGVGKKTEGKVRDFYDLGDHLVLVTSDRQSAFDRMLATVPYKGQVLNNTSKWWFQNTTHIVPNAVVAYPDPNVTIMKKLEVIPIEMVVRGYMTGSTDTSLWTHYKNGSRNYCGNVLEEGMVKNQRLEKNILTPTTKEADHDRPITPEEIVAKGFMSQAEWDGVGAAALALFEFGQQEALKRGLLLVDTKYEFGRDGDGGFYLIDEVHTPDSSRYWVAGSYDERTGAGLEPENIDKEFLRLWFRDNCDPYNDATLPEAPTDLVKELSRRYIRLFETITGDNFQPAPTTIAPADRIKANVMAALEKLQIKF